MMEKGRETFNLPRYNQNLAASVVDLMHQMCWEFTFWPCTKAETWGKPSILWLLWVCGARRLQKLLANGALVIPLSIRLNRDGVACTIIYPKAKQSIWHRAAARSLLGRKWVNEINLDLRRNPATALNYSSRRGWLCPVLSCTRTHSRIMTPWLSTQMAATEGSKSNQPPSASPRNTAEPQSRARH